MDRATNLPPCYVMPCYVESFQIHFWDRHFLTLVPKEASEVVVQYPYYHDLINLSSTIC